MSQLHKDMYMALLNGIEDVMEYINQEMVIPEKYGWDLTREVLFRLQAALQNAEDIYVEAGENGTRP